MDSIQSYISDFKNSFVRVTAIESKLLECEANLSWLILDKSAYHLSELKADLQAFERDLVTGTDYITPTYYRAECFELKITFDVRTSWIELTAPYTNLESLSFSFFCFLQDLRCFAMQNCVSFRFELTKFVKFLETVVETQETTDVCLFSRCMRSICSLRRNTCYETFSGCFFSNCLLGSSFEGALLHWCRFHGATLTWAYIDFTSST